MTKSGDQGETSLFDGQRVPKTHPRIELVGVLDELNSHLGLAGGLEDLQTVLFDLGAVVAEPGNRADFAEVLSHLEADAEALEATLPPLQNFILPGGHERAARLHVARSVWRRAERVAVDLGGMDGDILAYLNRLSDYLFLLARQQNLESKIEEPIWGKV